MRMFVKRTACLLLACFLLFSGLPAVLARAEPPEHAGHWAGETIDKWLAEGLIQGFPDGTFRPDESVTRSQFARLVNAVFGFTAEAELAYDDVPQDAWYVRDLAIAVQAGYLKGYAERELRPEQAMTRQEVAVVLARLLNLVPDEAAADGYADVIPAWSKGSVGAVTKAGYMSGYPDQTFRPARIMTRAEAVTILDRILNSLVTTFDAAGTYGPETGTRTIRGHVVVKADHVTLRNMVITGNLTIAESVGDGEVTLDGVTVQGTTAILGGGENSIHIQDSRLGEVDVNRADGPVRIVISGHSSVATVTVHSGATIETSGLKGDGLANLVIAAPEGTEIVLDGTFNHVTIASEHVIVEVTANSTVKEMTLEKAAEVKGQGKIEKAVVKASGVKFERAPVTIETSPGVVQPAISQPAPSPSAPPSSGGGGGGGGGPVTPPAIVVTSVRAVNAITVEVTMAELAGATFTWNGKAVLRAEYRDGKYVLTVPYMTSGASNMLVIEKTGYRSYKNEHVVWTDPLTYEEGKLGDWVTDRTEPGEWDISEDGWITLTTKGEPSNNWYAWQGRKAATDMPVTGDWKVETEIRLTEELLGRDGVRTSVWLNVVNPAGENIDWAILQFRIDDATQTRGWQWWDSTGDGSWHDIPGLPTDAGNYRLAIHFSNGTVTQYINGMKVNEYTVDDGLSSVREVIFNSYSFGKAYTASWKVPSVQYVQKFPAGAKIISNADQLKAAIENQQDGETWVILDGNYNLGRFDKIERGGQTGWYFPITASDLTIIGESKEGTVITSDVYSPNGAWASQDHVSVWGDDVTIRNLSIKPKVDTNKAIEVMGKNFRLIDVNFVQNEDYPYEFAGSLFFNPQKDKDIGDAWVENVLIHDAWISASPAYVAKGTLTLKNTTIDFRGSAYANDDRYGVISKNSVIRVADGSSFTVWVDNTLSDLQSQVLDRVPAGTTVKLAPGTYYVPSAPAYPEYITVEKDGVIFMVGTLADTEEELRAALADPAIENIYVQGTIPLSSTLKIKRPVRIIGVESGATITRASTWTVIGDPTSKGNAMLISVEGVAGPVELGNITVSGAQHRDMGSGKKDYGSGINIYESSNVTLNGVTSSNNEGAGLIVNGSTVVANGLTTSGNGWYGVNVAKGSNVTAPTSFTIDASSNLNENLEIVAEGENVAVIAPTEYKQYPGQNDSVIYSKKPVDLNTVNDANDVTSFRLAVNQYAWTLGLSLDSLANFNEMPADQGRQQAVWIFVQALKPFETREEFKAAFEYAVAQEYHKYRFIQAVDGASDAAAMKTALEQHIRTLHNDRQDLIDKVSEVDAAAANALLATTYTKVLAQLNAKLEAEEDLTGLAEALLDKRNAEPDRRFYGVEKIAEAIRKILEEAESAVTDAGVEAGNGQGAETATEPVAEDPGTGADTEPGTGTDSNQDMGSTTDPATESAADSDTGTDAGSSSDTAEN